jgi:hypothetical protein
VPMKRRVRRETRTDHEMRDEEVLRANKELTAYFKGRRTEREARAALKIIKAFVRDRERADPRSLRPLPGVKSGTVAKRIRTRKIKAVRTRAGRTLHRPVDGALESRSDREDTSPPKETHERNQSS